MSTTLHLLKTTDEVAASLSVPQGISPEMLQLYAALIVVYDQLSQLISRQKHIEHSAKDRLLLLLEKQIHGAWASCVGSLIVSLPVIADLQPASLGEADETQMVGSN